MSEQLIHAFVTSRLDFSNSIFIGLPVNLVIRLQKIQNWAAKLIFKQTKFTHATPLLKALHWLPIETRIHFKVLILIHNCIYNHLSPNYLSELLIVKQYKRATRQSKFITLLEPRTNGVTYANRAFSVSGPKLWNSLPNHLKCIPNKSLFKSKLKTYLYAKHFSI